MPRVWSAFCLGLHPSNHKLYSQFYFHDFSMTSYQSWCCCCYYYYYYYYHHHHHHHHQYVVILVCKEHACCLLAGWADPCLSRLPRYTYLPLTPMESSHCLIPSTLHSQDSLVSWRLELLCSAHSSLLLRLFSLLMTYFYVRKQQSWILTNKLIPWNRVVIKKLIVVQFQPFMEPEGSLPCSQQSADSCSPKPDASSPQLPTLLP